LGFLSLTFLFLFSSFIYAVCHHADCLLDRAFTSRCVFVYINNHRLPISLSAILFVSSKIQSGNPQKPLIQFVDPVRIFSSRFKCYSFSKIPQFNFYFLDRNLLLSSNRTVLSGGISFSHKLCKLISSSSLFLLPLFDNFFEFVFCLLCTWFIVDSTFRPSVQDLILLFIS